MFFQRFNSYPIEPYLNSTEAVTQLWFNRYTLLQLLILLKIFFFKRALISSLHIAETYTKLTCQSLSHYSSSLSSTPYYLSELSNKYITKAVNDTNKGLLEALQLLATGVEELILFTIELVIGTYVCVLTATIDAAVEVALNATEAVIEEANDTVLALADGIEDGLEGLETVVNKVISLANDVESLISDDDSANTTSGFEKVKLTVAELKNWKIDSSINSKLSELSDSLPDFETVKNFTESLIDEPFQSLRNEINSTDYQILQVGELFNIKSPSSRSSQVCSTTAVAEFYDKLNNKIELVAEILIILLAITAVVTIAPLVWLEIRKFTTLARIAKDDSLDSMGKLMTYENRLVSTIGIYFAKLSKSNRDNIRWLVAYVASKESLILLAGGLAGVTVVVFQYIILSVVTHSSSLSSEFTHMATELERNLTQEISDWTTNTNALIHDKQGEINDKLFSWVLDSTSAINDTVSGFVDKMDEGIAAVFNDTPLYPYVKSIVECVITSKLEKLEEGLMWVHDNSEVSFPLISNSTMIDVLNSASSNSTNTLNNTTNKTFKTIANTTLDDTAVTEVLSGAESELVSALEAIIEEYRKSIKMELIISASLIAVWFLQFILGLLLLYFKNRDSNDPFADNLNIDLVKYDISEPMGLTSAQRLEYTEKFGSSSDPFAKVQDARDIAPSDTKPELIDQTLNYLITKDSLKYGEERTESDTGYDSSTDSQDEGESEVLSYHDDRHLTDQTISKRWFM